MVTIVPGQEIICEYDGKCLDFKGLTGAYQPRETPFTTKTVKFAQNKKQLPRNYRQNYQTMLQYSYSGVKRPRQEGALL